MKNKKEKEGIEKKEDFILLIRTTRTKFSDIIETIVNTPEGNNPEVIELKTFKRLARYGRDWFK